MCSPAIVLVIFKISHVLPRYRSIAGWHIKHRRWKHLFIPFIFSRIFVIIEFWQIFMTACTPPPSSYITACFADFFFNLSDGGRGWGPWRKGILVLAPPIRQNPQKKRNKELFSITYVYKRYWAKTKTIHVSPRHRIFDAGKHMIQSVHTNCWLAFQKSFLLFKGPRSFKQIFKIGGNIVYLKP